MARARSSPATNDDGSISFPRWPSSCLLGRLVEMFTGSGESNIFVQSLSSDIDYSFKDRNLTSPVHQPLRRRPTHRCGILTIFQASLNYLIDTFELYAASAIASNNSYEEHACMCLSSVYCAKYVLAWSRHWSSYSFNVSRYPFL